MIGSVAFLEPEILTSPRKRSPPVIRKASMPSPYPEKIDETTPRHARATITSRGGDISAEDAKNLTSGSNLLLLEVMTRPHALVAVVPLALIAACAAPSPRAIPPRLQPFGGPCSLTAPAGSPESCVHACAQGHIGSCTLTGRYLAQNGEPERAAAYLDMACYDGSGQSCALLAGMWARGGGLPVDFIRAAFYHRRACDTGAADDCSDAALFVGREDEIRIDVERLAALYDRACANGHGVACFNLGLMTDIGIYDADAALLYRRACARGNAYSCDAFAARSSTLASPALETRLAGDNRAPFVRTRAATYETFARAHIYAVACRTGHSAGCYGLARQYTSGGALPQDGTRAEALYAQACTLGDVRSCLELQRILETPRPLAPALPVQLASVNHEAGTARADESWGW